MINLTDEQINTQLESLKESTRDIILKKDWPQKLFKLGQKYTLHIDQIGSINGLLFAFMIGTLNEEEFTNELTKVIPKDQTDGFLNDLNTEILIPIRQELEDDLEEEPEIMQKPLPVMQPKSIVEEKLSSFTQSQKTISDHSISKPSSTDGQKKLDPYREPVN